ncbi:hypothetical protein [Aliagarivorans taiwanensis]|uniref:hypothetical protein n=1 Tax=Aliagarivorans taiwanensis TaxID=561966 RepID=UPI0004083F86|nr:hypothetical protein [Aliagarivorans taiwanensis]
MFNLLRLQMAIYEAANTIKSKLKYALPLSLVAAPAFAEGEVLGIDEYIAKGGGLAFTVGATFLAILLISGFIVFGRAAQKIPEMREDSLDRSAKAKVYFGLIGGAIMVAAPLILVSVFVYFFGSASIINLVKPEGSEQDLGVLDQLF